METADVIDRLSKAIEGVLKAAKGEPAAVAKKAMGPEAFVAHALSEIEKAAKDAPERAVARLAMLQRAVQLAKQSFVDQASESIQVEVFQEETTAAADRSEKEISPVAAEAALGNSAFAVNAEDLAKALAALAKELEPLKMAAPARTEEKPAAGEVEKADPPGWPLDMNTREFREGVSKAEDAPAWGHDPGHAEPAKA